MSLYRKARDAVKLALHSLACCVCAWPVGTPPRGPSGLPKGARRHSAGAVTGTKVHLWLVAGRVGGGVPSMGARPVSPGWLRGPPCPPRWPCWQRVPVAATTCARRGEGHGGRCCSQLCWLWARPGRPGRPGFDSATLQPCFHLNLWLILVFRSDLDRTSHLSLGSTM